MIHLHAFGGLHLADDDGHELHSVLAQPRRQAVLLYLAIATPRGFHRRESLLALLWPEFNDAQARAALSRAIHYLRQSLGSEVLLSRGHEEVGLDWSRIWCDVAGFETALDQGQLAEGVALYRADIVPGFHVDDAPEFEQWLDRERDRLRGRAVHAARILSERAEAGGERANAVEWARRALALAPFDEPATRHLMSSLDRAGDRAGALHAFEELVEWLGKELDAGPAPETVQLAEAIRAREFAPVAAPAQPVSTNTPTTPLPPTSPGKRSYKFLPWAAASIIVLLLITLKLIADRSPRVHTNVSTLAIFPFTASGDSSAHQLSSRLLNLLAQRIEEGGLPTVKAHSILSALKGAPPPADAASALALVRPWHPGFIVIGEVAERGDSVHVGATVYDSASAPRAIGRTEVRGTTDEITQLVDRLAWQLATVEAVGVPLVPRSRTSLSQSLPALKKYFEGEQAYSAGHFQSAVQSYHAAVQIDTTFATAYLLLNRAATWTGELELAAWSRDMAWTYARKLAPLDQFLLRAWRAYEGGRVEESERYLQLILANQPSNADAWLALGELRFHWGPILGWTLPEAEIAFERSRLLGANADAIVHLARIAAADDRLSAIDSLRNSTKRTAMDRARHLELDALRAFVADNHAEQQRIIGEIGELNDAAAYSIILPTVVYTARHHGTVELARVLQQSARAPFYREAGGLLIAQLETIQEGSEAGDRALNSFTDLPARVLEYRSAIAALPFVDLGAARVKQLRDALASAPEPLITGPPITVNEIYEPRRKYLIGILDLKLGDTHAAEIVAQELELPVDVPGDRANRQRYVRILRAELQRAAGNREAALTTLGPPQVPPDSVFQSILSYQFAHERFLRAELNRELGNYREAMRWYETFPDPAGYDLMYLPAVKARKAEIAARLKQSPAH